MTLSKHTHAELDLFVTDLNGQLRGKRLPLSSAEKVLKEGFKMPRSAMGLDYWGDDVVGHGLVFETGDNDGTCIPIDSATSPIPWQKGHHQLLMMMSNTDNSPFHGDPRQVLKTVLERYQANGLTPVVATELEFYLLDQRSVKQCQAIPAQQFKHQPAIERPDAYSIDRIDSLRDVLSDIRSACEQQNIPADSIISEFGQGQFELNLNHVDNALLAADHAILLKRTVKAVAQKHGYHATFMAKPYGDRSGNGLHIHYSVLDNNGNNIFDNGGDEGSELLTQSIAGLLGAMDQSMLIFAPNANSYRRFMPGSHAPMCANWGYENRTAAVRVPDSPNTARRIEHRVSGADANPYLVIASILAAAWHGMENKLTPPTACEGDTYSLEDPGKPLPTHWYDAIATFQQSDLMHELLGSELVDIFTAVKHQEYTKISGMITNVEYATYL